MNTKAEKKISKIRRKSMRTQRKIGESIRKKIR